MWSTLLFVGAIVALAGFLFSFLGLRAFKKGVAYNNEILRAMYRSLVEGGKDGAFVKVIMRNGDVLVTIVRRSESVYLSKEDWLHNIGLWKNYTNDDGSREYSDTLLCDQEILERVISELSKFDGRSLRLLVPAA